MTVNCYRVFMLDGYCGLYSAENEEAAKETAIKATEVACEGAAMTAAERRRALTVKSVECLTTKS